MTIETLEIAGLRGVLEALRLPFNKEPRSKSEFKWSDGVLYDGLAAEDFVRVMYMTSLKIDPRDIDLMRTLVKRGDEHAKPLRGIVVYARIKAPLYFWYDMETYRIGHERLFSESTMHGECKGLYGEELQRVKGSILFGHEHTKVDMFSYQCLRRIVWQRHDHRLPEFHQFVDWIRTLPFAKELIFAGTGVSAYSEKEVL